MEERIRIKISARIVPERMQKGKIKILSKMGK